MQLYHPKFFWIGTFAIIAGVFSHLPMFLHSASMNYQMAGMPMDGLMIVGMFAIVAGLAAAFYGVLPSRLMLRSLGHSAQLHFQLRAIDDATLTPAHRKLIATLVIALIVDVMKPATLGFVIPGMTREYELERHTVALFPLSALMGTFVGSVFWGVLADKIGRRPTILLSALLFMSTSICGAMPSFAWNVAMCFMMGLSAGGLLPVAFTLVAEMTPVRHRGWILVLIGSIGTTGGYLAASGAAALLEPYFGWRVLWFMGLPTGLALIVLNRYIPESPRFLLLRGRLPEAQRVLSHYSVSLEKTKESIDVEGSANTHTTVVWRQLFYKPYGGVTFGLILCGIAWGLVNFGFLLWLPANLRQLGMSVELCNTILAKGAIMALPGALLVTWLYQRWSSKNTLLTFVYATAVVLLGFVIMAAMSSQSQSFLTALVVLLLITSSGVIAILIPYSSEIYPLSVRGTGSGMVAGSSKLGGILGVGIGVPALITGLAPSALVAALPVALSAIILGVKAIETRGRRLEEINISRSQSTLAVVQLK